MVDAVWGTTHKVSTTVVDTGSQSIEITTPTSVFNGIWSDYFAVDEEHYLALRVRARFGSDVIVGAIDIQYYDADKTINAYTVEGIQFTVPTAADVDTWLTFYLGAVEPGAGEHIPVYTGCRWARACIRMYSRSSGSDSMFVQSLYAEKLLPSFRVLKDADQNFTDGAGTATNVTWPSVEWNHGLMFQTSGGDQNAVLIPANAFYTFEAQLLVDTASAGGASTYMEIHIDYNDGSGYIVAARSTTDHVANSDTIRVSSGIQSLLRGSRVKVVAKATDSGANVPWMDAYNAAGEIGCWFSGYEINLGR